MIVKILERLEAERKICLEESALISASCIQRIKEIVQEVAKEYGKDTNVRSNGWIPCSEQMPQENKLILIYAESTARGGSIRCVAELRNGFWFAQIASDTLGLTGIGQFKVIAWQPLPAPYQKGEGK